MPDILPNVAILKSPSNWFLVAFAMAILAFTFHLIYKDRKNG